MTRNDNSVTNYEYDLLGRMILRTAGGFTDSWTYDNCSNGIGSLCSESSSNSGFVVSRTYGYNASGNQVSEILNVNGDSYAVGRTYDYRGLMRSLSYPGPDNVTVLFEHDVQGRVSEINLQLGTSPSTVIADNFEYLPSGPVSKYRFYNGQVRNCP